MPQIDLFFDDEDKKHLLEYLLGEGFSFVPDIKYPGPKYKTIMDLDSYLNIGTSKPTIFLTHPSYLRCPLQMNQLSKGDAAGKFYIVQRSGGPVIDAVCPGNYTRNQSRGVAPGLIAYQKTYWNTSLHQTEDVPMALKEGYKKIVQYVKANSVQSDPKGFFIGIHAASEFIEGKVKLVKALRYPYSINQEYLKAKPK